MENITAIVLAAGLGTRMKAELPKVLHKIGSSTILDKVVSSLNDAGVTDIVVVVGHKAEEIEAAFKRDNIQFAQQTELSGSGPAVEDGMKLAPSAAESILVTCGDTPLIEAGTYTKLIEKHLEEDVACTFLTTDIDDPSSYGRVLRKDGAIVKIVEEKDASPKEKEIREINVGTYCFKKEQLKKFIQDIPINEKKGERYLTDIIDILAESGEKIASVSCGAEEAIGINTQDDLKKANEILNKKV